MFGALLSSSPLFVARRSSAYAPSCQAWSICLLSIQSPHRHHNHGALKTNFFIFLRCAARFDQYSSNTIVLFSPRAYVCQKERIESDHSGARDGLEYFFAIAAIAKSSIAAFLGVAWSPPPKIGTTALATYRATQSYNNLVTLFYLEAVGVQSPRLQRDTPNPRRYHRQYHSQYHNFVSSTS